MAVSISEFRKALTTLQTAVSLFKQAKTGSEESKAFRDACIQRFEYCIEMSWKVSMKILGSSTVAAKPAIREMARSNLIQDPELWLSFIDARNNTSHSYEEDVAIKVFQSIEQFLIEAPKLLERLETP